MIDQRVIYMQYTGIKDKNGKEIYEGDIVHIKDAPDYIDASEQYEDDFIARVIFCTKGGFPSRYELKIIKTNNGHGFISSTGQAEYDIEVIGNIYENPELIK